MVAGVVEFPTEFPIVTVTLPRALLSPLNVKGTVSSKVQPFVFCDALQLVNHAGAMLVKDTVAGAVSVSVAPLAGWKVNVALVRSCVVEKASRTTLNPVAVVVIVPELITGARGDTIIPTLGLG